MSVVAAVDDLFFGARIRETGRQTKVEIEIVPTGQLLARAGRGGVKAVILDLGAAAALDILRKLKGDPETAVVRVVGYASHVATETIAAAREAGCDQILARSAFTRQLPELLQKLASSTAAGPI